MAFHVKPRGPTKIPLDSLSYIFLTLAKTVSRLSVRFDFLIINSFLLQTALAIYAAKVVVRGNVI